MTVEDPARLQVLYQLGRAFAACTEIDDLARLVVDQCCAVLNAEGASILLLDADANELYFPYVASADPDVAARLGALRFPADRGIAGEALRGRRAIRVDDVASDPRFYGGVDEHTGTTTRAVLAAPLNAQHGTIGVIQVINPHSGKFAPEDLALLEALSGSIAVAIENARLYAQTREQLVALQRSMKEHEQLLAIRQELDIARRIQQSILPRTFPAFPRRTDFEIFAAMIPAREVGGDFYDFFFIDDARLGIVIGDVSGKGVPAAIFMAVSRTLLKATAASGVSAAACLERVNQLLIPDNGAQMFVTVFYGVLDTRTGLLEYSVGGHPLPLLLRRDGRVDPLEATGGLALGVIERASYATRERILDRGDSVLLYTDGVTEATGEGGRLYGDERLRVLLESGGSGSPEAIIRGLIGDVRRHAGDVPQSDDLTVLAITYRG